MYLAHTSGERVHGVLEHHFSAIHESNMRGGVFQFGEFVGRNEDGCSVGLGQNSLHKLFSYQWIETAERFVEH